MANAGNPANAQPTPNVFNQSAGAYNTALGATGQGMMGPNIGAFMNPYTNAVTDRTLGGLERQRQMQMNDIGASATQAGAFGGSRHGVAESLTNEAFARQGADTLAGLNMQGFDRALSGAQNQQQALFQGAGLMGGLAGQGFGMGQDIAQRQQQQGASQQGLMQMLIDSARQQYQGYTQSPQNAIALPMAAVGGAGMGQQSQTTSQKPGLFNYLSLGLGLL